MLLLGKMAVLFIYMLLGVICRKKKFLDDAGSKTISFIVLNIAGPALTISGAVNRTGELEGGLMPTVIAAVSMYAGLLVIGFLMPYILRVPKENVGVYRLMTIFSNIGFMGFPVALAMFGTDALLPVAIFQLPFNVLIYTYGIYEITRSGKTGDNAAGRWKEMINIGTISSIATIVIYACGWKTPAFFNETMEGLGALTGPLSMIVIGMSLGKIPLKDLFTDVRLLIFTAIKLIGIPVTTILILKNFIDDPLLLGVMMIMLATPVGSMTAMLAEQYDGDTKLTSRGVALSTLLSVVTIPLVGFLTL